MAVDYNTPRYTMKQAADASGIALNTLRSFYQREHFRIVGGEAKKGRGMAAELTLSDIMCIAVAKVAIDAGVHAATAFEAGMKFAYSSPSPDRLPSHLFDEGLTLLICEPVQKVTRIVQAPIDASLADLFDDFSVLDRAQVVLQLNRTHERVLATLGAGDE